ncbi:MAG: hypothetical protein A2X55_05010 [Nitrospirae bacterium GWB2_47_37]|nr:MAG: hypothetical protein A2X55_05010 [Nitrospirae bacterium GWB2_47_37]
MTNKLACIVLTKDEEKNIGTCLANLKWVDELFIVDSGSTDTTLQIAERYDANIFINRMNPFIISEQRNWAIHNCPIRSEWILFIDADEIITDSLKKEILFKIDNNENKLAFRLCFKFIFMGKWLKHTVQFPSWHDRLLKKGFIYFTGGVWEHFDCEDDKIGYINEPYLHYGFNNGISGWIDKHNRYSTANAQRIFEYKKQKINWRILFKNALNNRNRKRELEKILSRMPILFPFVTFFYLYFIKRGFWEGLAGFVYSLMLSANNFFMWLKVRELEDR